MEELLLELALREGWKYQLLTYPNPPVGAAGIFRNRLFVEAHREAGGPHGELALCWKIFREYHPTAPVSCYSKDNF